MVSFSCEGCGDILTKKKLDPHRNQCWGASYTCIDCMVHFQGTDYRSHTSCMSEAQKYQGALYREKKPKGQQQQQRKNNNNNNNNNNNSQALVPRNDAAQNADAGAVAVVDVPPRAPTPPAPVNVFDFLVTDETPNAAKVSAAEAHAAEPVTPAPKEGKKDKDTTGKKSDKKRKRQQEEDLDGASAAKTQEEQDAMMVDAPPVLHSGLTDGVDKLLPPGQEYAEGGVEGSPSGPSKRTKQSKSSKKEDKKSSKERSSKARSEKDAEKEKKRSRELVKIRRRRSSSTDSHERERKSSKPLKSIGYRAENGDNSNGALVLHKRSASSLSASSRAELLLSYLAKDVASEHGISFNKALKKYHRERQERGLDDLSKHDDEKELWKSIRLRKNDRGEIVLFTE